MVTEKRRIAATNKAARWLLLLTSLTLGACAAYAPQRLDDFSRTSSYQSKTIGDVTVAVTILTDAQAETHFGVDLRRRDIQALWISVRNASPRRLWLIRNAVDPDLYSADEVALLVSSLIPDSQFETMRQYLRDESIRVMLLAQHSTSGFIFVPRVEGGRYVDIRLASDAYEEETMQAGMVADRGAGAPGSSRELRFGFAVTLPDGIFDYERLDTETTYGGTELPDLDSDGLRRALQDLPCCATNADGDRHADPLNVAFVGDAHDLMKSLSRSGWSFTHRITLETVRRMISAAMEDKGYAVAPVSSLYSFGRKQDIALQRARHSIAQRNHMRLWLAPFLHQGRQVWLGQVSRDIGVKVTTKSPTLTTHVIDPEVDLTREYLLHSLLAEGYVERFGFVRGSTQAPPSRPARNLTGDPYFSDGMRLVVVLSTDPVPYERVRSLLWEKSSAPIAEGQTDAALRNVSPLDLEYMEEN